MFPHHFTPHPQIARSRHKGLKRRPGRLDVDLSGGRMNAGVGEDDHYVGVAGEKVDVGRKGGVAHFHALELGLCLAATVLD